MRKELLEGDFNVVPKDKGISAKIEKIAAESKKERGKLLTKEELEEAKELLKK